MNAYYVHVNAITIITECHMLHSPIMGCFRPNSIHHLLKMRSLKERSNVIIINS